MNEKNAISEGESQIAALVATSALTGIVSIIDHLSGTGYVHVGIAHVPVVYFGVLESMRHRSSGKSRKYSLAVPTLTYVAARLCGEYAALGLYHATQ